MNIKKIKIGDKVRAVVLKSRYQAWQNMEVVNIVNGSLIICEHKNGESILQAGFVADELFPLPKKVDGVENKTSKSISGSKKSKTRL